MNAAKPPKKSETLEIRLSHATKEAFMERCRRDRSTASDAVRRFIDAQIDPPARQCRRPDWRIVAAGVAGLALGAGAAAPSFAQDPQSMRQSFDRLDRNHDQTLSFQEFRRR